MRLLYVFDELNRDVDIALDGIGSEKFASISVNKQLKYVEHRPEITENYIKTGERLLDELTQYIDE